MDDFNINMIVNIISSDDHIYANRQKKIISLYGFIQYIKECRERFRQLTSTHVR